jgi:hypothetical protein
VKPSVRAYENTKKLADMRRDMSTEQVATLMGPPDKIDRYQGKNNETVLSYLYITKSLDDYTSRGWSEDNFTPFVFVNDRLSGWGWNHLRTVAERHEFVLRPFQAPGR